MANRQSGNLPADLSSFVGRRQEVHDLRELLSHARLVSVLGPGGVGKSRLAVRTGAQLQRTFRDGVWLVELASVSDATLVPETVASALRVPERSGRDPVEALSHYLANRELVIVLDNCERLRDSCAALLAITLSCAPGLRVLATSQVALGLPGEAVYRLQPLAVSDPSEGVEAAEVSDAVALFVDRAANAFQGFTVTKDNLDAVVELCRSMDGVPLAIELAAAHARYLSPAQILERMDDRFRLLASKSSAVPARQQSLKAAVEWTYDLCSKPERLVWHRLSVFASTFDLPAAEAVCEGYGLTRAEVADAIRELVDRSVLICEAHTWGMQYRLLETLREYGLSKLREYRDAEHGLPEEVLRCRHLNWYARLAADLDRDWFGPRQHEWLERIHTDLPNVRAALSFAAENAAHSEDGLGLAGNLFFFWRVSGRREGEGWLTRLLRTDTEPSQGRARALVALSWLLAARGQATERFAETLATAERFDPDRVPRALFVRGVIMSAEDDLAGAHSAFRDALASAERIGSAEDRAFALFGLAWTLGLEGDLEEAELHFRASLALAHSAGDSWWRGALQFRHALVAWLHDDQETMAAAGADALRASRLVPDLRTCANALGVLAVTAVGHDDRLAAYLFGAAARFWEDAGGSVFATPPWRALLERAKARCREGIGTAAFDAHYRRGNQHKLDDAIAAALNERPQPSRDRPARQSFGLTHREVEIAELVSQGLTNKEIASRLVISIRTAESHVQHILTKTGFATRSQLAAWHAARVEAPTRDAHP